MSDLLAGTLLPKSFVVDENKQGRVFQTMTGNSYFNFIVFNKSGEAEGLTNVPCYGNVNITYGDNKSVSFDYRKPVTDDPVALAYLAYAADPSQSNQQAMIAAAMAKGVTFATDFSDASEKIAAYLATVPAIFQHGALRALNKKGAPVFDLGSQFPLLGYDGVNPYLQTLETIYAEQQGGDPARYAASDAQKAAMPNYCAVYFNGMMLVFELTPYAA